MLANDMLPEGHVPILQGANYLGGNFFIVAPKMHYHLAALHAAPGRQRILKRPECFAAVAFVQYQWDTYAGSIERHLGLKRIVDQLLGVSMSKHSIGR